MDRCPMISMGTLQIIRGTIMEIDSKGNVWYVSKRKCLAHGTETYQTGKISDSENTFEFILHYKPLAIEEWDPEDIRYSYRIYYRQE